MLWEHLVIVVHFQALPIVEASWKHLGIGSTCTMEKLGNVSELMKIDCCEMFGFYISGQESLTLGGSQHD